MKRILVLTDFSRAAYNATVYALHVAESIKANIELFHAAFVPSETGMAAAVMWPLENYDVIRDEVTLEFQSVVKKLNDERQIPEEAGVQYPVISYACEMGLMMDVVLKQVHEKEITLVMMGMSGASPVSKFILGSNSFNMINKASFPVLLIPHHASFSGIKKIAFATDLSRRDIHMINSLASLAEQFDAEILITHVSPDKTDQEKQQQIDAFLNEVTCKINYDKIYYRDVKHKDVNEGLSWLTENAELDMLVMVHRHHDFFSGLFRNSHTQKLARYGKIPLLVFPEDDDAIRHF